MEDEDYWDKKNKREDSNIVIGIIIITGSVLLSAYASNVIPAIVGIILAAIVYQRNN